jgi:shikimate 5-dehydrogenase
LTYYDLNYADHRLLEQAKANPMCVSCSDGIPMLETQAAMSLEWWKEILDNKKFSK